MYRVVKPFVERKISAFLHKLTNLLGHHVYFSHIYQILFLLISIGLVTNVPQQMSLYRFLRFILLSCLYIYIYHCDKNCTHIYVSKIKLFVFVYIYMYIYIYIYI